MRRSIGLVVLLVALVALAIYSREQSPVFQKCAAEQHEAYASQQQIKGAPRISVPLMEREPFASRCTGAFLDENSTGLTALATIVIAIFTVVLVGVTNRQSRLTKEVFAADKRAFVFANGIHPQWELDAANNRYCWRIRPSWLNSGDTPTRGLTLYVDCELRNSPLPAGYDFTRISPDPRKAPGNGLLGPKAGSMGGAAPLHPDASINPQDILDIQAGAKFLYLWGWVKYWDVFPDTPEHVTRFCWVITTTGDPTQFQPGQLPTQPNSLSFGYLHHSEGNCADDECA